MPKHDGKEFIYSREILKRKSLITNAIMSPLQWFYEILFLLRWSVDDQESEKRERYSGWSGYSKAKFSKNNQSVSLTTFCVYSRNYV